ncbi:hypothetical protein SLS64_014120 [Diaporthe eres]|uniref:Integral membrane protein n=1 Tax=Diaporthe eres TaxID=83184 RepID=A0ABR1P8X8_DIAER
MDTVGFVPEPNCGRGTVSIIWSCLTTIIFVVWTVLHPDTHASRRRITWSVLIALAPEAMPAGAIEQLVRARQLQKRIRSIPGWHDWTLQQSFLVLKKGIKEEAGPGGEGPRGGYDLSAARLVELAEQRQGRDAMALLLLLPTTADINKRSKTSGFAKTVAGAQALWFTTNVVARLADGLPVTPLEAMTLAYTVCGLVSALAWFRCPQDLEDPFVLELPPLRAPQGAFPASGDTPSPLSLVASPAKENKDVKLGCGSSPIDATAGNTLVRSLVLLTLAVFAGVHLAAWNYAFPSAVEAWIWRASSLAILPLGVHFVYFGSRDLGIRHWSLLVTVPLFVVVRLAVMIIAFTAFRRMPAAVFLMPDWPSSYWGHVGK